MPPRAYILGGCKRVGYSTNITVSELAKEKVPIIGMTDSSILEGGPVSPSSPQRTYGVFAFFPARYDNESYRFSITLFALFDYKLNFTRFFVRGSWGEEGEGIWKEVSLS